MLEMPERAPCCEDACREGGKARKDRGALEIEGEAQIGKGERYDGREAREAGERAHKPCALLVVWNQLDGMEGGEEGKLAAAAEASEDEMDE